MDGKANKSEDYILLANARSTNFQQLTPPRSHSPSSIDGPAHDDDEAEMSQLLLYTPGSPPQHSHHHRRFTGSKRRKLQMFIIYVGLALVSGLLLGAIFGSKSGGDLVGKYKDMAVGGWKQVVGGDEAVDEGAYDNVLSYLKSANATDGFRGEYRC